MAVLLRLASGIFSAPFWCLCQKISLSLFIVIKFLPHKSPEWSSLVSGPKAKSSPSEITNPTLFTISYQFLDQVHVQLNSECREHDLKVSIHINIRYEELIWAGKLQNYLRKPEGSWLQVFSGRFGRYHWLNGHEFEQALGVGDGQGSLACCSPWSHK